MLPEYVFALREYLWREVEVGAESSSLSLHVALGRGACPLNVTRRHGLMKSRGQLLFCSRHIDREHYTDGYYPSGLQQIRSSRQFPARLVQY